MGVRQTCEQGNHIGEKIVSWTRVVTGNGEKRSDFGYDSNPM